MSHNLKKKLFATIAYETFSRNEYLIEEKSLVKRLDDVLERLPNPEGQDFDGKLFLKSIEAQHGIFVERAQKYYSFIHLTFQEYFTACAIKSNETYQQKLMKSKNDPRWREVFLLTTGLLDDAGDFFSIFKKSIDSLITKDKKILEFLAWAKNKADSTQSTSPKQDIYLFYIILEFTITRAIARTMELHSAIASALDRALTLARTRIHIHTHTRAHTRTRTRTRAIAFALNLDFARIDALDFAIDLAIGFNSKDTTHDYELYLLKIIQSKSEYDSIKTINKSTINEFIEETSLTSHDKNTLKTSAINNNWSQFGLTLINETQKQDVTQ